MQLARQIAPLLLLQTDQTLRQFAVLRCQSRPDLHRLAQFTPAPPAKPHQTQGQQQQRQRQLVQLPTLIAFGQPRDMFGQLQLRGQKKEAGAQQAKPQRITPRRARGCGHARCWQ